MSKNIKSASAAILEKVQDRIAAQKTNQTIKVKRV